jgi:hypothetical protein
MAKNPKPTDTKAPAPGESPEAPAADAARGESSSPSPDAPPAPPVAPASPDGKSEYVVHGCPIAFGDRVYQPGETISLTRDEARGVEKFIKPA